MAVRVCLVGSASSGNARSSCERNLASFSTVSGEMPTTSKPAAAISPRAAEKSTAWVVHPGVMAAGKKYTITRRPA